MQLLRSSASPWPLSWTLARTEYSTAQSPPYSPNHIQPTQAASLPVFLDPPQDHFALLAGYPGLLHGFTLHGKEGIPAGKLGHVLLTASPYQAQKRCNILHPRTCYHPQRQ